MKLKKWVSMVLAAAMLAGLAAGCGGNSENAGNSQQQEAPSDPGGEAQGQEPAEEGQEPAEEGQEPAEEGAEITVVLRTLGTVEESG